MISNFLEKHNLTDKEINPNSTCSICLDNITNKKDLFCFRDCQHEYHTDCIKKWISYNKNCPVCRRDYP